MTVLEFLVRVAVDCIRWQHSSSGSLWAASTRKAPRGADSNRALALQPTVCLPAQNLISREV